MSFVVTRAVLDGPRALDGSQLKVMGALAEWADDSGRVAPRHVRYILPDSGETIFGIPALARCARLSERQVGTVLRALAEQGWLQIVSGRGQHKGNSYLVMMDALAADALEECRRERESGPSKQEVQTSYYIDDETGSSEPRNRKFCPSKQEVQTSYHPSESVDFKVVGDGARAKNFSGPITKEHSARRAAHEQSEQPKEGAQATVGPPEGVLPGDELADLEELRGDPVLWALTEATAGLLGQDLAALSAGQAEALAEYRRLWNGQITPQIIADQRRLIQVQGDRIEWPAAYLLKTLGNIASKPRAAPGGGHASKPSGKGNGNGNGNGNGKGLDMSKYTEPGGKYYNLFHPEPSGS